MSIQAYWGEFSVSPVPLEVSLNYCSHRCEFCFANLNTPDRTADMPAIMRLLANYENRKSVEALLLRAGYPVLASNRVDPFAHSNFQQSVPMFRMMAETGIPFAIQTRGGRGIDEVLTFAPPSVWYVSIAQTDDELRKKLEPGAPSLDERYELIDKLTDAGHRVVLGLNPLVPEWCPDPSLVLERARDAGAEGVWIEGLHLSGRQVERMTPSGKKHIGLPLIQRSMKRKATPDELAHNEQAKRTAVELGLEIFSMDHCTPTDFWAPYQQTYAKCFPVMQDFVNACWSDVKHRELVDFDTFASFFVDELPSADEPLNILHYIGAKAHAVLAETNLPPKISYRQLLAILWSEPRLSTCPSRKRCFAYAAEKDAEGGWVQLTDDKGLPYLVFSRDACGFDEFYTDDFKG